MTDLAAQRARLLPVGEVLCVRSGGRFALCQVVALYDGPPYPAHDVVVYAPLHDAHPAREKVRGAQLYVLRQAPKHQPLYLRIADPPPSAVERLGSAPVELGFELPKNYRTSARAQENGCPTWATWDYIGGRLENELRAPPQRQKKSKHFPDWQPEPSAVLALADSLIEALRRGQKKKDFATALAEAVTGFNAIEASIDTLAAEAIHEKLIAIAVRSGLTPAEAARIVDAHRTW